MAARPLQLKAPGSLAGTLAEYEAPNQSSDTSNAPVDSEPTQPEIPERPGSKSLYEFTLPSLHFLRWRPLYHVQAPTGWMNDPCGPGYDATTGLYHLFFQWNPRRNLHGSVAWGSIHWDHAFSRDMINWTISGISALTPEAWYDKEGCFTGCLVPTSPDGQPGQLTILYTGVGRLPLHYTLPYTRGTETLALAESSDGGLTWSKTKANPILPEPPVGIDVTGWRDPYVSRWPAMDRLLDIDPSEDIMYGMISGGVRHRTPTAFLYAVNPSNLTQWRYINAIVDVGLNHNISRWSGDMGINWECACFMTLSDHDNESSREFIVVGGEGTDTSHPESTFAAYPQESTKFPRTERSLQWMSGTLTTNMNDQGQKVPKMEYTFGGKFDHGLLYAVNIFRDPATSKQIAWGWITEEDLPQKLVDRQNWSGLLSLPRELSLITLKGVTKALNSKLKEITSLEVTPESEDTFIIRTLGVAPASCLQALRRDTRQVAIEGSPTLTPVGDCFMGVQTCRFELSALLQVSDACTRIGLSIFHNEDHDITSSTSIYLVPETETLQIERPDSTKIDPNILTFAESAPFTLFSFKRGGYQERELLELRVFFDESVVEVFANSRCTFSTRVYPASKRCWGLKFWAEDESRQSTLVHAQAWDGLRADMKVA
ncbi:hypothetical protein PV10_01514 [Exophiala mesophila]|uniref:Glycosyl hydrolase family 32 N-terminal domain-containing protein n=1 Tax=Exophiala mesophila TaxID=212818 RepID=A0A0D1ZT94_EXOME|nr:uncharacterized protein PV10_01514 [Exophiala mesophila]KIV97807.1 hypothetical protein PV10_01514 [Exophiala mesophila]